MAPTQNKVAIVTGGLSGIGDALTRTLIGSGWDVVALDLPSQSHVAQKLAEEHGDPFEFMACDVSQYQELAQCFSTTFEKKGRLDAFCSNAGFEDQSSVYLLANRGKSEYVLCLTEYYRIEIDSNEESASPAKHIVNGSVLQGFDIRDNTLRPFHAPESHSWRLHRGDSKHMRAARLSFVP
ncbi:hypothetical protein LTR06_008382 [Exophiala xenobiotica]|nr:hypothetical protein LTR06_008382 [Exophiala xenobiotica]